MALSGNVHTHSLLFFSVLSRIYSLFPLTYVSVVSFISMFYSILLFIFSFLLALISYCFYFPYPQITPLLCHMHKLLGVAIFFFLVSHSLLRLSSSPTFFFSSSLLFPCLLFPLLPFPRLSIFPFSCTDIFKYYYLFLYTFFWGGGSIIEVSFPLFLPDTSLSQPSSS